MHLALPTYSKQPRRTELAQAVPFLTCNRELPGLKSGRGADYV